MGWGSSRLLGWQSRPGFRVAGLVCEDRLPLKTIRQFCLETAREIAEENHGRFAGVERIAEEDAQ